MLFLYSFFCTFMFQIGGIYIANIIFVFMLIVKFRTIRFNNRGALIWMLVFIAWSLVSSLIFYTEYKNFSIRNLIQLMFNFQYLFLGISIKYDYKKFDKIFITCSMILAIYIIVMYIYSGAIYDANQLFYTGRMWGDGLIQGWPNSTALPLIFATYLVFKSEFNTKKFLNIIVFYIATFLTTSRGCILGATIIIIYFAAFRGRKFSVNVVFSMLGISIVFGLAILLLIRNNPGVAYRFSVTWDRNEILNAVIDYSTKRPLVGYGGNSFDVVYDMFGSYKTSVRWEHTHNTILELILRYGYIGMVMFLSYVVTLLRKLNSIDSKFVFILFWFLSLFQIYFRNFIFIGIIFFIIQRDCQEKSIQENNT